MVVRHRDDIRYRIIKVTRSGQDPIVRRGKRAFKVTLRLTTLFEPRDDAGIVGGTRSPVERNGECTCQCIRNLEVVENIDDVE